MVANNHHVMEDDSKQGLESPDAFDIHHYLRVLRKHKWPILIVTSLATLLAFIYTETATPIYRSQATLLIESQKPNLISGDELYSVDSGNSEYFDTQLQILKSRVLVTRVIEKLGLVKNPSNNPKDSASTVSSIGDSAVETKTNVPVGNENSEVQATDSAAQKPVERIKAKILAFIESTKNAARGAKVKLTQIKKSVAALKKRILSGEILAPEKQLPAGSEATEKPIVDPETRAEKAKIRAARRLERRTANQAKRFLANLTVSPVRNTNLIKISYETPNRDFAPIAANTVAEEYILSVVESRLEIKTEASEWLYDRLAILKDQLDISESSLFQFKQDNGLVDVNGSVERLNERELMLATTELASARIELSSAENLYIEVSRLRNNSPELLESLPAIQNDGLVRSIKVEIGQRQRELDELSNRYGSRHPRMVDARSRLASLRQTLDNHILQVVTSIEKEYEARRQRVSAIEGTLSQGKENIQLIGQKKFKLDALEREVASNRDLYNRFFNRISQANSADGLDTANARISDFAIPANSPIKPRKELIIALAALVSFALSVIMAFLFERVDETVKSSHDVENNLNVPLLGILPLIKKGVLSGNRKLPLNPLDIVDKKGSFIESVNTIQTELSIGDDKAEPRKIILITSSVPGEGKSSSALNLAHAFSQIEKVLIIDCDMRRPSIAKALGGSKDMLGLSDLITGSTTPQVCIQRNAVGSIDVLASGPIPSQPLALLSCARFEEILNQLRKYYDRIIIDSAPTQAVSDALILSKMADAVVYVVKSHTTSISQVKRGLERLSRIDAKIAGVLVTQVDIDKISAYGGDYYFQGYYDYYGYSENSREGKNNNKKDRLTIDELQVMRNRDTAVEFSEFEKYIGVNRLQNAMNAPSIDVHLFSELDATIRETKG